MRLEHPLQVRYICTLGGSYKFQEHVDLICAYDLVALLVIKMVPMKMIHLKKWIPCLWAQGSFLLCL